MSIPTSSTPTPCLPLLNNPTRRFLLSLNANLLLAQLILLSLVPWTAAQHGSSSCQDVVLQLYLYPIPRPPPFLFSHKAVSSSSAYVKCIWRHLKVQPWHSQVPFVILFLPNEPSLHLYLLVPQTHPCHVLLCRAAFTQRPAECHIVLNQIQLFRQRVFPFFAGVPCGAGGGCEKCNIS